MGIRKLQSPHAAPEISLPESKCSLLRRAHPNEGNAEAKIFARDAGSQPVRGCILAHAVPTPTRRWLMDSLSEATYSLTMWLAARIFFPHYPILIIVMGVWGLFCTRMKGMWNLSIPHALLKIAHPSGACSLILSFHGGMGAFLHPIDGNVEPADSVRC